MTKPGFMSDDLLISTIAGLDVRRDNGSGHLANSAWGRKKKKRQSTLHRSLGKSIGPNFSIVQVSHLSHCNYSVSVTARACLN